MYRDIEKTVYNIMLEDERSRSDDKYLICRVLEEKGLPTDLKQLENKISLESITRARRRIQATNPQLQPSKKVKELREEMQEDILVNVLDRGCANG